MGFWDRLRSTLRREAAELGEATRRGMERLEGELERKQRELDATPAERVDMILEEIDAEKAHLETLEEKVRGETGSALPSDAAAQRPSPHLDLAAGWLDVAELAADDPMANRFSHRVGLPADLEDTVGGAAFSGIEDEVRANVFVLDAEHTAKDTMYVRAPTLGNDEVALLVAATFAAAIPEPEEQPPRGATPSAGDDPR
jgi:hypothetical protein